ncbi:hypothetical protein VTN02DRAFT_3220 [Thermoascus thermophilus]
MSPEPSDDCQDADLKAAIAASLRDLQGPRNGQSSGSAGRQGGDVVDLTADSDEDDELVEVFPKSKSTIGSETDEEEDEHMRRAIALSMQQDRQSSSSPSAGDETEEQRSEGSKRKQKEQSASGDNASSTTTTAQEDSSATPVPVPVPASAARTYGLLGLDRKQMEQERLARLAKRKAEESSISPPQSGRPQKMARSSEGSSASPENGGSSNSTSSSTNSRVTAAAPRPSNPPSNIQRSTSTGKSTESSKSKQNIAPSSTPGIQFPNGVVKKTWALGCPRQGDDIKIEEVFQRSDLELAVLSAFIWDMEWLFSKLDTNRSRFLLVMQAKDESTKRRYEARTAGMKNLRLCFPPMDGQVSCMHSKLMLLFHPNYVRIVVPSANLVPFDWGEAGTMENTVFLIDLPKKSEQTASEDSRTPFYEDLVYFLRATTLHENIIAKLSGFDFSKTAPYGFVHTIGGSHSGEAWKRTGHCGLGRAVSSLGLRSPKPLNVDFVTSSVGSLTDEFLRSMYLAAQGDDGLTAFVLRTAKSFPAKNPSNPNALIEKNAGEEWKDRFNVYFPSEDTVKQAKGGPLSAGTICFQSQWYEGPKFPRQVLRDCVSRRPGLLMHNKMLFARPEEPIRLPDGSRCRAWAYVGSANLSESAW